MKAGIALVVGGLLLGAAAVVGGTLAGIAADEQGATGSSIPYFAMLAVGVVLLAVGVARLGRIRAERAA
ncbi:hypothetical protein [Agrococcus terreus]|uniref:Uncharacterized protein n=1 Tax=Agrococcus terreus TaxID=574649 RepID=A0ABQ2KKI5_9MICO|nr:hypothetical protein [Agrococcus terreus]GGN85767.1 hypothetical protein GCM10010968_18920 [Agrococcus terreus]